MIAGYLDALRGAHRNTRLMLTISALLGFTIDGGIYTVLLNLYILRLNFGPEFVGLVNSSANFVFAFGSLAAGWLGGRWGSRPTMILGLSLTLVGTATLPLADGLPMVWRAAWLISTFMVGYSWSGLLLCELRAVSAAGDARPVAGEYLRPPVGCQCHRLLCWRFDGWPVAGRLCGPDGRHAHPAGALPRHAAASLRSSSAPPCWSSCRHAILRLRLRKPSASRQAARRARRAPTG